MVVVPGGSVHVSAGSTDSRFYRRLASFDVVVPRPIAVARTETTVASFRRFAQATGIRIESGCWYHTLDQEWKLVQKATWSAPGFTQAESHAVVCVAFEDAQAYAAWLSAETGTRYRLPTESELEYFNRAGHDGSYGFDVARVTDLCISANGADLSSHFTYANPCVDGYEFTSPVGTYPANAFGLYDTTGNVWELTSDCWTSDYERVIRHYLRIASTIRVGGSACSTRHVVRGGSFLSSPDNLQIAKREIEGYRSTRTGFRVVRDLP